ncbi:MAG: L-2-amino-thiazoline-4-carboxylic acid hydrolase [Lachnotalea sp.]
MGFNQTIFKYFHEECINRFGKVVGNEIFINAEIKLTQMICEADYLNSKALKWHMDKNMLPTIAMYLAFKEYATTKAQAYEITLDIVQIMARNTKKKNQMIGKMPFGYTIFKLFCKAIMRKQYPKEGWNTQWITYDNNEIHFDYSKCIYMEITKKYNCPEVCPIFCANDETSFAGYAPNIVFEHNNTIGRGNEKCDFHFKNGNLSRSI